MDKRVSISHIVTTVGLASSLFYWGAQMDNRISRMEVVVQMQEKRDKTQDDDRMHIQQDFVSRLSVIDNKLDRLIERELRR